MNSFAWRHYTPILSLKEHHSLQEQFIIVGYRVTSTILLNLQTKILSKSSTRDSHTCKIPCICWYNLIFAETDFMWTNFMQVKTILIVARLIQKRLYYEITKEISQSPEIFGGDHTAFLSHAWQYFVVPKHALQHKYIFRVIKLSQYNNTNNKGRGKKGQL